MELHAARSLWSDTIDASSLVAGTPLGGNCDADVAIVGAGLTGLWTAWHLARRDPTLRIRLVERDTVGFGASGRNGGWCSALLPMPLELIAHRHGRSAASRMQSAMFQTVDAVAGFVRDHDADCWLAKGGTISLGRNPPQVERLRAELESYRSFGFGEEHVRWLDERPARDICGATKVLGGLSTPHCAAVHPLRLTHAVASDVQRAGTLIHDHTRATSIEPGRVITDRGVISAEVVVRATEGYTPQLPGQRRSMIPIYSMMVATEPIPQHIWDQIGLADRPTFADGRHMIVYGQRTGDDRIAFGGRGAPYHFGSSIEPSFDTDQAVEELLCDGLHELFPVLRDIPITHHWGGVLGASRDWTCSVRFDRASGLASAGGYVGDGVSTTHLAGRTLAALITDSDDDQDRELVRLPWVGHRSRRWEPEPLRWLGVNAMRLAARWADHSEERSGRRSRFAGGAVERVLGH